LSVLTKAATPSIIELIQGAGVELVEQLLPNYLTQQRWFGGKSRTIRSAKVASSTPIDNGTYVLALIDVTYDDESSDRYQLPLAVASGSAAEELRSGSPKAILATLGDASKGAVLYDASASEGFRQALIGLFTAPASDSEITASHSPAFDPQSLAGTKSRVGSAEQSNTSILFDEVAILKLFRRLQPGENPDVEMTRFLTDTAHFKSIPAYLGELHSGADEPTTLAFLQAFASNEGDGWSWFSEELTRFYEAVANSPAPVSLGKPASFLTASEIPEEARERAGLALGAAALLGTRTAEMHIALATPTTNPAFAAEPTIPQTLEQDSIRIRDQAQRTLEALKRNLTSVPDELADRAALLLSQRGSLLARAQAITAAAPQGSGQRIRIHGDYHLGQLLRSKSDFLIVDFEGEPARSLEERRQKQSPLKDVAGMLRSFSYASRSALDRYTQRRPEKADVLSKWATLWENTVSSSFLQAYRDTMQQAPVLIPEPKQAESMLLAFLLEKSLYELLYELNNRPTWLHIPLNGLLALVASPDQTN